MTSYPIPHTTIYPIYCYSNFSKDIFSIGCTTQLLVCLIALAVSIPIIVLIIKIDRKDKAKRRLLIALILTLAA